MRVLFILGTKSELNATRLKEQVDSIDITPFGTIREMMDTVSQRNDTFDRIVISTASMNDENTMEILHTFLKKMHPRATVVFIFQGDPKSKKLAGKFNRIFSSPLYTDVAVTNNSISFLEEIATRGIDAIREKYSINKYGETDADVIEDSYPDENGTTQKESAEVALNRPMLVLPQNASQKKRTGMFGLKKLSKSDKRIISENLKLVSDYMKSLASGGNDRVKPKNTTLPDSVRKSMSNPVEEYKTTSNTSPNEESTQSNKVKKSSNLVPNTTFTQLELGYYGFATEFNGRPMLFRTGISVEQVYK